MKQVVQHIASKFIDMCIHTIKILCRTRWNVKTGGEKIMIPETAVDWKAFAYKFSDNPQRAFEELSYYLFCNEHGQKNGIFRYHNQPHIETNPIQVEEKIIGLQAKYYTESVNISTKE